MEVYVFKTDVPTPTIGEQLITEILKLLPVRKVTIDLEDIDKVLRLEGQVASMDNVTDIAQKMGVECQELTW